MQNPHIGTFVIILSMIEWFSCEKDNHACCCVSVVLCVGNGCQDKLVLKIALLLLSDDHHGKILAQNSHILPLHVPCVRKEKGTSAGELRSLFCFRPN